jgi:hypothetical protein
MIPPAPDQNVQFNPPPGWDVPTGFDPRLGHLEDPAWPTPPPGWEFWVRRQKAVGADSFIKRVGVLRLLGGIAVAAVAIVLIVNRIDTETTPTGVGSCWAVNEGSSERHVAVRCGSADAAYTVESEVTDQAQCPETSTGYFEDGKTIQCLKPVG